MHYMHKDNSSSMKEHDETTCKIDTTPQLYEGEDLVIKSTPQWFLVMDATVVSIFFESRSYALHYKISRRNIALALKSKNEHHSYQMRDFLLY